MNYFNPEIINKAFEQTYAFIQIEEVDHVLTLTLNRAEKKNALHPHMIQEIAFVLQYAHQSNHIWAVIIEARGNVFCAGADLKAFMGLVGEFNSSIPESKEEILVGRLFQQVHKPIIAKVEGSVYAGGFFFLAGSTYVVANEGLTLGLPEVKRGLYPFQVMAALLRVMPRRKVIDWCIRGYNLEVEKAAEYGLVTHVSRPETIDNIVQNLVAELKENSPSAIRFGLEALDTLESVEFQDQYLLEMLQKTIGTKDGIEGLTAFREKRKPIWTGE